MYRLIVLCLAACGLFASPNLVRAGGKPDVTLHGRIAGRDNQSYRVVPFEVPTGVSRITVVFDYTGREEHTTIDLGLLGPEGARRDGFAGPDGFRGWSGGSKNTFTVSATDATPSYLPGVIRPGRWNLLLGIPNIRPGSQSQFTAEIYFARGNTPDGPTDVLDHPLKEEPGWYRGDLHMHTGHSDGSCSSRRGARVPCPFFLTLSAAVGRGLDFVAVSEHNTVSHLNDLRELQPYYDDLLLIPAMEVTTFQGHANAFGITHSVDFRVGSTTVPDWNALLDTLGRRGVVVSINHPIRPSGEACMGCGWRPTPQVDLRRIQAVEVVNGPDADTPYSGIDFWHQQLDRGQRLTGIGGSDNHDAGAVIPAPRATRIGSPTTVVYAKALSVPAIKDGLRAGNVFVDVEGSRDRLLELTARAGDQEATMGAELRLPSGSQAELTVHVSHADTGRIELIRDGSVVPDSFDARVTSADYRVSFVETGDGARHWLRVNVRNAQGRLMLVGNPIYVNWPPPR